MLSPKLQAKANLVPTRQVDTQYHKYTIQDEQLIPGISQMRSLKPYPCNYSLLDKNAPFKLNAKQTAVMIGCLLGDGMITKEGQFMITHSWKQKNYAFWLAEVFPKKYLSAYVE